MKVRRATPEDLGQLVWLARDMHAESTYAHMKFDVQHCALNLSRFVSEDRCLGLVVDDPAYGSGEVLVAALLAELSPAFFGPELMAVDYALFVTPRFRGRAAVALRLVATYVDWAKRNGARRVSLSSSSRMDCDAAFVKLAEKLGMSRVGSVMYLEI